jgi:hypothetical protein
MRASPSSFSATPEISSGLEASTPSSSGASAATPASVTTSSSNGSALTPASSLLSVNGHGRSGTPQTPQTEYATVAMAHLRTSTPGSGIATPPPVSSNATLLAGNAAGEGAVNATNAMPGSVLPSATSLKGAQQAQKEDAQEESAKASENGAAKHHPPPVQPENRHSNGIPGL